MKKIIAIISGCLVAILLAVTIVLACTKFTAATVVSYDKVWAMEVYNQYHASDDALTLSKNSDAYKEILKLYKESLKENNLSSLFQGAKGFKPSVKSEEVKIVDILDNDEGTYVFCLMYEDAQKLVLNGENYVNPNSETNEVVTFEKLYIQVKNTASYTKTYRSQLHDDGSERSQSDSPQQSRANQLLYASLLSDFWRVYSP